MASWITRRRIGHTYQYFDGGRRITDPKEVARINALVIPPAWQHVEIAKAASAKVQARGQDAAGRVQMIYHPLYRLRQEKRKFDRILRFGESLPALRRQLDHDLRRKRLGKEKVLACTVKLIDEAYFRVGNKRYAREHQTYGVSTLRSKHADIHTTTVTFDFTGKSGKHHNKTITDPQLARIITQLDELPGHELFRYQDRDGTMHDVEASHINEYIKRYMGEEFTAKDFRTWGGTLLAAKAAVGDTQLIGATAKERKKIITAIVTQVAKQLGNTPAVARSAYIDPRILSVCEDDNALLKLRTVTAKLRPKKYISLDEQSLLCILRQAS